MSVEKVPHQLREMVQTPDWYRPFGRYAKIMTLGGGALGAFSGKSPIESARRSREHLIKSFETLLEEDAVALGQADQELEDWDNERKQIDTIVVHHTSRPPGLSLSTLNAMHLLRLYVPRYQSKDAPVLDSNGDYQPIHSGHFDENGRPVFYGYHHLVRRDGTTQRLLADTAIGWHAGNWDVNRRSIAICVDDDLTTTAPTDDVVTGIAKLVHTEYPDIPPTAETIQGHNEITQTECPGNAFLKGWKLELLNKLNEMN